MASPAERGSVTKRRATLLGGALLVAVLLWWLSPHSGGVSEVVLGANIQQSSESRIPPAPVVELAPVATAQTPPVLEGFNVSVRLQYDSTDALVLSKVREYHEALVSGLLAVPGLRMVADHAALSIEGPEEFRLTISSIDPLNAEHLRSTYSEWAAFVSVEALSGDAAGTMYGLGMVGDVWKGAPKHIVTQGPLSGKCATPTFKPCAPVDIAERHVMALRKHVFRRDESLVRELETRFLDDQQPEHERQRLRNELKATNMVWSDAMVRGAVERLTRPIDTSNEHAENERYDLLVILAGQRHKEMVQPLIDFALRDSDVAFRIETLRLLAKDFPEDYAVRNTLESIASNPSDPLQGMARELLTRLSQN